MDRDKSSRLQVVAWLVSEEIERRPLSLFPPLPSFSFSLARSGTYTNTYACLQPRKVGRENWKVSLVEIDYPRSRRGPFVDVSAAVKPEGGARWNRLFRVSRNNAVIRIRWCHVVSRTKFTKLVCETEVCQLFAALELRIVHRLPRIYVSSWKEY